MYFEYNVAMARNPIQLVPKDDTVTLTLNLV